MKFVACTLAVSLALLSGTPSLAASVPDGLADANTSACRQLAAQPRTHALDPLLPTDPAKVPAYCGCVSKTYWSAVPQADYDGMMAEHSAGTLNGEHAKAIRAALHDRMAAARQACRR